MTEKKCLKYQSIFNNDCDKNRCIFNPSGNVSSLTIDNGGAKLNLGYANPRAIASAMMEMKYAGLIDYNFGDDVDKKGNRDGYDNHCKMKADKLQQVIPEECYLENG